VDETVSGCCSRQCSDNKNAKPSEFLKISLVHAVVSVPTLTAVTTTLVHIKTTASGSLGLAFAL
jgi:hypothetical protein